MFSGWKRRRAEGRVRPGDGSSLERYRWWQPFSRSLFHIRIVDPDATPVDAADAVWSVDVRHWGDEDGEVRARLYRDGTNTAVATMPAAFAVPGGVIDAQMSGYGIRRMHYVAASGGERQLAPDAASAEGRRARLAMRRPGLSAGIGALSILVLVIALVLGVPQLLEQLTSIPMVAEHVGTFVSPIVLPAWLNWTLVVAALLASTERALRLRYHWLLDGGLFEAEE